MDGYPFEQGEEGPKKPSPTNASIETETITEAGGGSPDLTYEPSEKTKEAQGVGKGVLDRIVRTLNLSQKQGEALARELKKSNALKDDVKVTAYHFREARFVPYFTVSDDKKHAYCNNVAGLVAEMGIKYDADDWRLFIDSSKSALKGVLLQHENIRKPIPVFTALK